MAKGKVGRPKGSGGKQPNWKFTKERKKNLVKARKVIATARKRAGVGVINSANKQLVDGYLPPKKKKKG